MLVALFAGRMFVGPTERAAEEMRVAMSVPAACEAGGTAGVAALVATEQADKANKGAPVAGPSEPSPAKPATTSEPAVVAPAPPNKTTSATAPRKPQSSANQQVFNPASVARLLQERREDFRSCSKAYHRLRLAISDGHATLLAVDGMNWADVPLHTCFRDHILPLTFTGSSEAPFVVALDLRPSPKAP
jgi:hypothetical protein